MYGVMLIYVNVRKIMFIQILISISTLDSVERVMKSVSEF